MFMTVGKPAIRMKKILSGILALMLLAFLPGMALAQQKPSTPELREFERNGGKLVHLGKTFEVDGWLLVNRDGTPARDVLYILPSGAIVKGFLYTSGGTNITKSQFQLYHKRQDGSQGAIPFDKGDEVALPPAEVFYSAAEKSNWVRTGMVDAPYVYMFINVNCEHCQSLWRTLKGSVDKGLLQLRIIPLGEQDANLEGGAALLSSEDPGQAWQEYMDGKKGTLHKTKIKGDALEKMRENNKLAKKWKLPAMPFLIYRKVSDGTLLTVAEKLDNPMQMMSDLVKMQ